MSKAGGNTRVGVTLGVCSESRVGGATRVGVLVAVGVTDGEGTQVAVWLAVAVSVGCAGGNNATRKSDASKGGRWLQ